MRASEPDESAERPEHGGNGERPQPTGRGEHGQDPDRRAAGRTGPVIVLG